MRGHLTVLAAAALALAVASAPAGAAAGRISAPGSPAATPGGQARPAAAPGTAGGLVVSVGYAEDKEINTPDPAAFPVPWAGSPGVTFLGGTVPGQSACGTLTACYDAGAIRLDNPTASPVTVAKVVVNMHASLTGARSSATPGARSRCGRAGA